MPTATINDIQISYTLHNPPPASPPSSDPKPKPWIILINGLADPQETWSLQLPALLATTHPLLTFDNRGVGSSSAPAGPYTAAQLANDAHALVLHLQRQFTQQDASPGDLPKIHLLGVSMGGMIAQEYLLAYPERLVSVTLACTYASPGRFCGRMFEFWADTAVKMGVRHVMRDVLLWCFTQSLFDDDEEEEEEGEGKGEGKTKTMLVEVEEGMRTMTMSTEAYLAQLAVIQKFDSRARLRALAEKQKHQQQDRMDKPVPCLVLAGEEDILIPVSLSQKLHGLIPWSEWKTVKGGHGCCWEFPDDFNRAVVDFVERVEREGET